MMFAALATTAPASITTAISPTRLPPSIALTFKGSNNVSSGRYATTPPVLASV